MKNRVPPPTQCEHNAETSLWQVARRDFLKASGLVIASRLGGMRSTHAGESNPGIKLRFGIVTDAHFADGAPRGSRHYRESVAKMAECVTLMNEEKVDFLVELGDFKDQGTPPLEQETLQYLATIEKVFRQFAGPRYHVVGNHDVDSLSKAQFLANIENTDIQKDATYYTLKAMVEGSGGENNAFAIVEVDDHCNMVVNGYHKAMRKRMDCHVGEDSSRI